MQVLPPCLIPKTKIAHVKFLSDSFAYCSEIIPKLTTEQLERKHNSPDGNLPGRERAARDVRSRRSPSRSGRNYLRDKGIRPPGYRI